jgi:hypothetical protein
MESIRQRIEAVRAEDMASKNYLLDEKHPKMVLILGDLPGKKALQDLDYVIFDERIVACANQILGPQLVYWGDSSFQTGEGVRGFHKDNVTRYDPNGADWQSDYTLVRIALYLQDHSKYSGGIKLRVKSHLYPSHHEGKAINVGSEVGDIVMWNLRTTHSGNNVRLRWMKNLCLHPRLEDKIPNYLRVPEEHERVAIFCTFGKPSDHLDRYMENMVQRGDYDPYLKRAGFDREIVALAKKRGIEIRRPMPEYGSLYPHYEEV